MPLQSSGPISLADIQTEFGGVNPIGIDEYYAGGANNLVPAGTTGINGAVPSSGQISFSQFYGTSAAPPFIFTTTLTTGVISSFVGYSTIGTSYGGLSNAVFTPKGVAIREMTHFTGGEQLNFVLQGGQTNDGWTSLSVGGFTYNRASASFSTFSIGGGPGPGGGPVVSQWQWTTSGERPFGTIAGAIFTVNFS